MADSGPVSYTHLGMSNHAGTTMMANRKDALVGMAKLIVATEERARELNDTLVFTVGKIAVSPGQENVIPGQAVANFEMRHMDKAVYAAGGENYGSNHT